MLTRPTCDLDMAVYAVPLTSALLSLMTCAAICGRWAKGAKWIARMQTHCSNGHGWHKLQPAPFEKPLACSVRRGSRREA
jgi:hypothetical protein